MSYSFSKDIDYSKNIPAGEYEVQITKLEPKPIHYTSANGDEVETDVLNIQLTIRDDWNENPETTRGKTIFDSAFRRGNGFDAKIIGQIVNAIPRENNDIEFANDEELLAYMKGACVRVSLKYGVNKKGNQVRIVNYEISHIKAKDTTLQVNEDELPF